ncbi:hypothetical protein [Streptomyces sp. 6N223]|uniref:hypothetical protein n=1 Tax=Streptomyces sp. 6N223 TaxID=3457412 RepID=UPI003FD4B6B5
MNRNALASLVALGLIVTLALNPSSGALAHPATDAGTEEIWTHFGSLKGATAAYRDVAAAEADGYVRTSDCVAGKGIHYLRTVAEGPDELDIARPNALVYAPRADGSLELHGIEYVSRTPATLFGVPFELSKAVYHYTLHVWLWEKSPEDLFAADNPRITCEA